MKALNPDLNSFHFIFWCFFFWFIKYLTNTSDYHGTQDEPEAVSYISLVEVYSSRSINGCISSKAVVATNYYFISLSDNK